MTGPASYLVVGSGASAATAALALSAVRGNQVTVLDLGGRLEDDRQQAVDRMVGRDESSWGADDLATVTARARVRPGEVPQKRSYGSDYPFRDLGQNHGIVGGSPKVNLDVASSAYGGFTNVWGAQLMPFHRSAFDDWPISWAELEPHYRAVLDDVPLAAEDDDLAEPFPLLAPRSGLPPLGARTTEVLARYGRHRSAVRARGVTVGRARLAFRANDCTRCGLCMTGCPYGLIYSAAQTMDRVRRRPNVRYLDRLLVERIGQDGDQAVAWGRDLRTGQRQEFRADRLFVGAGSLGSTRLVLGSLPEAPASVQLTESRQFVVPFVSGRRVPDPRRPGTRDFTLNQFNLLVDLGGDGSDAAHLHCYPYNPTVGEALPRLLQHPATAALTTQALRRLTVAFGYLPSTASPPIRVTHQAVAGGGLPHLTISEDGPSRPEMLGQVLRRLVRVAPRLDLWPVVTSVSLSGPGKSYHFGGSFAHRRPDEAVGPTSTDRWGRLAAWDRVHLVDGAVLPSVPSTTFTFTVMANAHRIVSEVLAGEAVFAETASLHGYTG